jgi:hypothetical protein
MTSLSLVLVPDPPRRPCADTEDFPSSWTEKLVSSRAHCTPPSVPLPDVHDAAATPAELTAAVTDAETRAPRTNTRAASVRLLSVTRFPLVGV